LRLRLPIYWLDGTASWRRIRALKTPEARGGWAHLAPNACRAPMHTSPLAIEWRLMEGAYITWTEEVESASWRDAPSRRGLQERLLLEPPFGVYAVEPAAGSCCPLHKSRRRHAARSRRRYTTELMRMSQGRQSWRGSYAAGYKTQKDLRPVASGKAQPREAPLEVEVVQLQQSQPTTLVV